MLEGLVPSGRAGMFESMILATSSGALLKFGSYPILFKSVKKSSVEVNLGYKTQYPGAFTVSGAAGKARLPHGNAHTNADRNESGVAGV